MPGISLNPFFAPLARILVIAAVLLASCRSGPREEGLVFETIEQDEGPLTGALYQQLEPMLIVVASEDDASNISGLVSEQTRVGVSEVDYSETFAVLALQGWKETLGYGVNITRIIRVGNSVDIYADFIEPDPDQQRQMLVSSPFHLVRVQQSEPWNQEVTFRLFVSGASVLEVSHFIP